MSDPTRDELVRRFTAAVEHRLSPEVRTQHLRAIRAAASALDAPSVAPVAAWRMWTRRAIASVSAAAAVALPGAAVAAQDALPGDALYGLKRATEPIVALVDGDVRTEHRADELEALLADDRDDELAGLLAEVEELLRSVSADDEAVERLRVLADRAEERLADRSRGPARSDEVRDSRPTPATDERSDDQPRDGRADEGGSDAPGRDRAPTGGGAPADSEPSRDDDADAEGSTGPADGQRPGADRADDHRADDDAPTAGDDDAPAGDDDQPPARDDDEPPAGDDDEPPAGDDDEPPADDGAGAGGSGDDSGDGRATVPTREQFVPSGSVHDPSMSMTPFAGR